MDSIIAASAGKDMILKDARILVAGGGRGIGKTITRFLLKEGARVVISSRSKEELEASRAELEKISRSVYACAADVSQAIEASRLVRETISTLGGVDVLINAAGIYGPIGFSAKIDIGQWKKTFEINLFGTFMMFQSVAPFMMKEKKGKIVNFSGGGDGPLPNFSAYNASKAGVVRLTETLAAEMKEYGIDINSIAPGPVNTRFLDDALAAGESLVGHKRYEELLKQKKEGGVPPERAAELCVFLASHASDGLTGKLLSPVWDDWKKWDKEKISEIMSSDIYTLRRVIPRI